MKRFFSVVLLVVLVMATIPVTAIASSKSVIAYVVKKNTTEYNSKGHVVCRHNVGEKLKVVDRKGEWCKLKNGHYIKFLSLADDPIEYFLDKYSNDIVFVSISKQNVVYIKNGKIIAQAPCVSGDVKHRPTPTGLYTIGHKKTDSDLMGKKCYHVQYFIGFNGKIGFHDAPWRNEFGSNKYKKNGSHGCINLPLWMAEIIYKKTTSGKTKVVVLE